MKYFIILILFLNSCDKGTSQTISSKAEKELLNHFSAIINTDKPRNYKNIKALNSVAEYIKTELKKVCDSVAYQNFTVDEKVYKNVIGSIGIENKERIIIGAHYDVFGNSDGADDNASGVVGLLELARLLAKEKLNYRIDFVAYTLEEPPFFRTEQMGSFIHANYLLKNKIPVKGMICLESIGYYNEKANSQKFPIKEMEKTFGNKGDFITVVQNEKNEAFSNQVDRLMKREEEIKTQSFKGNSQIPGVDFSDHLNYWKFNFEAVMITNTAFYRNKNYHTSNDTLETLDVKKMRLVIQQLYKTIKQIE